MIANRYMPAEDDVVGEDHRVADMAVVRDVASHHEQAALADTGHPAAVFSPGVHGDALAQFAARANNKSRISAAIMN
jgi:hypothetical protein